VLTNCSGEKQEYFVLNTTMQMLILGKRLLSQSWFWAYISTQSLPTGKWKVEKGIN